MAYHNNPQRLDAHEAARMMCARRDEFHEILRIARSAVDMQIKDAARYGAGYIHYTVPRSMWGRSRYDPNILGRALAMELAESGYDIQGNTLRFKISWESLVHGRDAEPLYIYAFNKEKRDDRSYQRHKIVPPKRKR